MCLIHGTDSNAACEHHSDASDTPPSLQKARTALHLAASRGHGDVVEALLKAACNTDIQNEV